MSIVPPPTQYVLISASSTPHRVYSVQYANSECTPYATLIVVTDVITGCGRSMDIANFNAS